MDKWRIKKGDNVQVITGGSSGTRGEVIKVLRDERRVVVKGVNICIKHRKPSMNSSGGIERLEQPIHVSNVMLIDSSDDKPTRVGYKIEDGKKLRVSKRTGTVIS
jgi:large subunit ribosomal protein L24